MAIAAILKSIVDTRTFWLLISSNILIASASNGKIGAFMVGIEQIFHDYLPLSSIGLSDCRKVRPYSRASRKAESSEIEPLSLSSQLPELGLLSNLCWRSKTTCSRFIKRRSSVAVSSMAAPRLKVII